MSLTQILLITNDKEISSCVFSIFSALNYNVIISRLNHEEVTGILNNKFFDLVIIDILLGDKCNGIEIYDFLVNTIKTPFLLLLPLLNTLKLNDIIELRPKGVVFKPIKSHEIYIVVSILLNNSKFNRIIFNETKDEISEFPFIIKDVVDHVRANIFNKIEVTDIAKITPWSYDHFIKVFSKSLGLSPYQYILSKKIEKSKSYIAGTDLPLSEIACKFSFESYSNYNRAFRKIVGCTPSQYRSNNKVNYYLGNYNDFANY